MKSEKGRGIYNAVVIGAGTAGLVAAAGTAGLGGRVALIERGDMGGDCLNFGCVPSKALISSARLVDNMRHCGDWGLDPVEPRFDFAKVFARMRGLRAKLAPNDSQERFESLGVDVFRGDARFVSPHAVEVDGVELKAKNFVIATGTRPAVPSIAGLEKVRYLTNETVFDELEEKPESMLILGGGAIGCELGWVMNCLGVKVTVLQRGPNLLPKEDEEVCAFVARRFAAAGITFIPNATATSVISEGSEIRLGYTSGPGKEMQVITASRLLAAAGRTPNIERLGLDKAGVVSGKRGVPVNAYLQTSRPHIYAAGDVTGPFQFTHMADAQARVIVRNILMPLRLLRQKMDYSAVPWCTYLSPEVATVGLNERAAKKKGVAYDLVTQKVDEVDRAVLESTESGFMKVLLAKGSDRILGATLVCEHAGELMQEVALAIKSGIGLGKIGSVIHAYPTYSELIRKAADKQNKTRLTPVARKVFSRLYARARRR